MADTKISALTAVTTPAGTDEFPVNQGAASKKMTLSQIRASLPTVPTIVSVGSAFSSTGAPTATLPGTHAAGDILVLCLETSNEANLTVSGYTQLGPKNGIGGLSAGSLKLSIFWKVDGGSESAPTIADSGDHTYGVMFAVRGCPTTVDPFAILGQKWKFTASVTGTSDVGTTMMDNCLIVSIFAHAIDSASAQASSPTNAGLTSVTEAFDGATTDGIGGGICVVSGIMANRGTVPATTVTWAASTVDVSTLIAFRPADSPENGRPVQVQTFIGSSPDLDDLWVKPSGAVRVHVQLVDGGGSGSGGNTTTTAAGGGGGGGGGYAEQWYRADDLGATVTVHAGKGGAAGSALNQAGNAGVLSEFDKGNAGPLTSTRRIAGTAATAAASADGGNGGCGSGYGLVSPAVATTRISIEAATAGAAVGGVGGRGGSGTTAPTGGSPAYMGGGGGESGGDTDTAITSAANGYSLQGGGGGAGGRTNTNVSGPGMGGGAAAPTAVLGANGNDSTRLPYGGSGACAGGSTTVLGGTGGFPGGGGGGGGGAAGGFGGAGGHGIVVVSTHF
jgi:hypothetical protein